MPDLAIVMPVYNEEECIADVINSWIETLSKLEIDFGLLILNDGSKDNTGNVLNNFKGNNKIKIINKKNTGHGPTIIMGYLKAVEIADWVFQCDSDDEIKAEHFVNLWKEREKFDALFGVRKSRRQNPARKIISKCSCITIELLYGKGIADVNVPYRMIRSDLLKQIVKQLPENTFAPNVIISGVIAKSKKRILNIPVPHEGRKTGRESIVRFKLWKCALKSFWQTLILSFLVKTS